MTDTKAELPQVEAQILEREKQRCDAMKRGDIDRLKQLLHPDLTHVHAKGQVDSYESYFRSGGTHVNYEQIDRSNLRVQVLGETAVMTGRQLLVAVRKMEAAPFGLTLKFFKSGPNTRASGVRLPFRQLPLQ